MTNQSIGSTMSSSAQKPPGGDKKPEQFRNYAEMLSQNERIERKRKQSRHKQDRDEGEKVFSSSFHFFERDREFRKTFYVDGFIDMEVVIKKENGYFRSARQMYRTDIPRYGEYLVLMLAADLIHAPNR